MTTAFRFVLLEHSSKPFLASRTLAAEMRRIIESHLDGFDRVVLDFTGVEVTQSFTDELVGVIAYKGGAMSLRQLSFHGCTSEHKKIIGFVVNHRLSTRIDLPKPSSSNRPTVHA